MIVRSIIYIALFYFAVRLLRGLLAPASTARKERTDTGEDMVKDLNCNTYIPVGQAISKKIEGELKYFCSEECLKEYREGEK